MAIRYRYALSAAGNLVDIQAVDRSRRGEGAPFSCLSCTRELIPALGEVQAHHFRHKQGQDCSSETYRHRLAKRVFVAEYERCLREHRPFHLVRQVHGICSYYKERFDVTCRRTEPRRYDLTRWFDRVDVETVREGFRADVLLWSERHDDVLFVEMAVTHTCDPAKQQSGIRIIEILIETEDDALALGCPEIDAHAQGVQLYNFQDPRGQVSCDGDCRQPISMFVVYPNGSAAIQSFAAKEVAAPKFLSGVRHKEILTDRNPAEESWKLFRRKLREAHFAGTPVRHCFMCRYHGVDRLGAGIWCKVKKHVCESNEGAVCEIFKPLPSTRACDRVDQANEQFLQVQASQRQERRDARLAQRAKSTGEAGLTRHAGRPRGTPGGRARIHWSGSSLLDSLHRGGLLMPPPGTPRLGRVVDWFLPRQEWRRQVVWVACWMNDTGAFATLQSNDDPSSLPIAFIEADDGESMEQAVYLAFDTWSKSNGPEVLVDSPMDWEPLPGEDPPYHLYPLRYRWSMAFRRWILDDSSNRKWGE